MIKQDRDMRNNTAHFVIDAYFTYPVGVTHTWEKQIFGTSIDKTSTPKKFSRYMKFEPYSICTALGANRTGSYSRPWA